VIAARAVDAALCGISEDVFLKHGVADFFGDILFFGKRFACGFVFDEFDSKQKSKSTNFADVWVNDEWRERLV